MRVAVPFYTQLLSVFMVIRRRFVRQNPEILPTDPTEMAIAAREAAIANEIAQQNARISGLSATESTIPQYPGTAADVQGYTTPSTEARMLALAGGTPEMVAYPARRPTIDELHEAIWPASPTPKPSGPAYPGVASGISRHVDPATEARMLGLAGASPADVAYDSKFTALVPYNPTTKAIGPYIGQPSTALQPVPFDYYRPLADSGNPRPILPTSVRIAKGIPQPPPQALSWSGITPLGNSTSPVSTPIFTTPEASARSLSRLAQEDTLVPTAEQLQLDLGSANQPLTYEQLRLLREQDAADLQWGDALNRPRIAVPANAKPQWVSSPSGLTLVDPRTDEVLYRPSNARDFGYQAPPPSVPSWLNDPNRGDAIPPSPLLDPVFNNVIDPDTLEVQRAQSALDLIRLREQGRLQVGADQLRLDLDATAPVPFDYIRQARQADQERIDLQNLITTPDANFPTSAPAQFVSSTSGPMLVDPHQGAVLYKPDARYDPTTGSIIYGDRARFDQSMPGVEEKAGLWDNIVTGIKTGYGFTTGIEPGTPSNFSSPAFMMALPKYRQQLTDRMDIERLSPVGRVAGVVGGVVGDIANFGTQHLAWRMHPMDVYGSELVPQAVANATGLDRHRNRPQLKRYTIPLVVGGGIATHALSNNFNPFTLFDPTQAGRAEGFRAATSEYENPTEVTSYPGALYQNIFTGTSPYLLPWDEFRRERPEVSYDQYRAYQEYLWGNHDLQILGGLVKATDENIDAPTDAAWYDPRRYEARIAGYRITPLGALGGLGTLALGSHLIRNNLARRRAANRRRVVVNPNISI